MKASGSNISSILLRKSKRPMYFFSIGLFVILAFINVQAIAGPSDTLGVRTIIIDPGHGGKDPGCLGAFSHEADVALAISLKLGEMIKEKYGDRVKIVYTRTKDEHVGLQDRATIANKHKGDLFICIHANSGASHAHGSEVYALGLHRTDSQLKVAERENSTILMEDDHKTKYKDFDPNDPDAYIMITHLANTYMENSLNFAGKIQKYFQKTPELTDRGVKQAGFLVLHQVNMPSVLIETGFLTNKEEEKVLNDKESQKNIALAIFNAFVDYKEEMENINGMMTNGGKKDDQKKDDNNQVVKDNPEVKKDDQNTKKDDTKNNKDNNPVNPMVADEKIWFMVQIAASTKQLECKPSNFKGLEPISEIPSKGIYRYNYGKSNTFEEAKKLHAIAREKGYTDAFIVAYRNGERMEINKAIGLAKQ